MSNCTELRLDRARSLMQAADGRGMSFYVARDEHPVAALKKLRAFLPECAGDGMKLALAVAGLERVIDQLDRFKLRRVFEEE